MSSTVFPTSHPVEFDIHYQLEKLGTVPMIPD